VNSSSLLSNRTLPRVKDWPLYWTTKYRKDLTRLNKTGLGLTPIIKELVGQYKLHPKSITPEQICTYIDSKPLKVQPVVKNAIYFFYRYTVSNQQMVDFLINKYLKRTFSKNINSGDVCSKDKFLAHIIY
jgi:hypothetical protein